MFCMYKYCFGWSAGYITHSLTLLQVWLQYSPSLNTVTSFPAWILDNDPLEWERATGGKDPDCLIYVAYTLRGFIARFCPQKRHNEELSSFCIMDSFSYTALLILEFRRRNTTAQSIVLKLRFTVTVWVCERLKLADSQNNTTHTHTHSQIRAAKT